MAWTNTEILKFIELYRNEPIIWNPKHGQHKNKNKVNDAWQRLADTINIPVNELKKKKESLMTTFRNHYKKRIQSIKSGMGEDEVYDPIWPFYEPLEAFLKDVYECCSMINTEENEVMDSLSSRDNETTANERNDSNSSLIESSNTNTTTKSRVTASVLRRRSKHPPELTEASREMANAFGKLNRVLENKTTSHDDDCDLYAKLLAAKLRKFPENEREEIMLEIDSMLMNRRRNSQNSNSYVYINRPCSSQSSYQSEWSRSSSSPYNRPHSAQTMPSAVTTPNVSPHNRPHSAHSIPSTYATIPNLSLHNRPHTPHSFPSTYITSPDRSPHNPPHSAQSIPSTYATHPNQSPYDPHSAYFVLSKPQTQRIQIISNKVVSQSSPVQIQELPSPEQPIEIHVPESHEIYNNLQSGSTDTQNLIYLAYKDA